MISNFQCCWLFTETVYGKPLILNYHDVFLLDIFESFGGFGGGGGGFNGFSRSGINRGRGRPGHPFGTMEFEDIAFQNRGGKQDPPINYDLMVSYEELFTGATKKMKVCVLKKIS